ncbi:MAG: hypothetical protein AB1374_09935 [Bacillota bacterium]
MRRVYFQLIGNIPVVGPVFGSSEGARRWAIRWVERYKTIPDTRRGVRLSVIRGGVFHTLTVTVNGRVLFRLNGLDELLLQRLYREVGQKQVLVFSSFISGFPEPTPIVLTEGLGLMVYQWPVPFSKKAGSHFRKKKVHRGQNGDGKS